MKIAEQIKLYTTLWQETNALYEKWAKKHGLSYYELLVILSLADKSACKQKDICQVWQLPKQTVHTILKEFVQHGWVELTPCEDDRRNKTICLTPIGEKNICAIAGELQRCERAVWKKLGAERANALIEYTRRYNQYFQEAGLNEDT